MEWLREFTGTPQMYHLIIAILIAVVFYFFSHAVKAVIRFVGKRISQRTKTELDDKILDVILGSVKALMSVIGLHIAVREIRKGLTETDVTADQLLDYAGSLLYVILVYLVIRVIIGIIRASVEWYLDDIAKDPNDTLKLTLRPITKSVVTLVAMMVGLVIVLDHFGVNIGSLLLSLGVGSLAVALAAQDTLANMIAGFVILVDRPFRVGDRVVLESGDTGDVYEIGLRSTKILNFDQNLVLVPNATLIKGRIINLAYPHNQMRAKIVVGVAYGTEPAKVRRILLGLAENHPDILKDPPPEVYFTAMVDSAIEFTLVARAADFTKRYAAENLLREQAYLAFEKEDIEIPFPQRVVHMKSSS